MHLDEMSRMQVEPVLQKIQHPHPGGIVNGKPQRRWKSHPVAACRPTTARVATVSPSGKRLHLLPRDHGLLSPCPPQHRRPADGRE